MTAGNGTSCAKQQIVGRRFQFRESGSASKSEGFMYFFLFRARVFIRCYICTRTIVCRVKKNAIVIIFPEAFFSPYFTQICPNYSGSELC